MIQFINYNWRVIVICPGLIFLIFLIAMCLDLWFNIELASWVQVVCTIIFIIFTIIQENKRKKTKRSRVQTQYNQTYKVTKSACCRLDNALEKTGTNRRQRSLTTGYIKNMKVGSDLPEELTSKFSDIKVELDTLNNEINSYFPKKENITLKNSTLQVLIIVIESWIELSKIVKGFRVNCKSFPAAKCSNLMKHPKIREKVRSSEAVQKR